MKSKIERLGKVSITVEKDYWDKNKVYNRLTIVERQGTRTAYLSRKAVPIGVDITDRNYWITISKWADIPYEIVQEFGDSTELVISQKVVTLKVNELQGFIDNINDIIGEGGSIDERIAAAKSELIDGASEEGDTFKKIEDRLSDVEESVGEGGSVDERIAIETNRAQVAEELLREAYESLSQSQAIPKTAEEWAAMTSWEEGVIYRVAGTTSYTDYMYNGTTTIPMATYNNAIDEEPTARSNNLVRSGGVYNSTPTVANSTKKADLAINDEDNNTILRLANGHIQVKNFSSFDVLDSIQAILYNIGFDDVPEFSEEEDYAIGEIVRYEKYVYVFTSEHTKGEWDETEVEKTVINTEHPVDVKEYDNAELGLSDEDGNIIVMFANGHIRTKNFNSSNIKVGSNGKDWSDEAELIELPIPSSIAKINIKCNALPTSPNKDDNYTGILEYCDREGNYFSKNISSFNLQGRSSLLFPKHNFSFDIDDGTKIRFGNWIAQDSFHLKANYIDAFRGGRGIVSYRIQTEISNLNSWEDARPWRKINKDSVTIYNSTGNTTLDINSNALGVPDGLPCELYVNGEFYGLYTLNLKKHRDNMAMLKADAKNIQLDGEGFVAFFNGANTIDWTKFEIRNPKYLVYADASGSSAAEREYDADVSQREIAGETSSVIATAWNNNTTYSKNALVTHNDRMFLSLVGNNSGNEPVSCTKPKDVFKNATAYWIDITFTNEVKQYIRRFANANSNISTKEDYEQYLDSAWCIDYLLQVNALMNIDCIGNNTQWCTWDGNIWFPMAYDQDQCYGLHWSGTKIRGNDSETQSQNPDSVIIGYTTGIQSGTPLTKIFTLYKSEMDERYKELIDKDILTTSHIMKHLNKWVSVIGIDNFEAEFSKWDETPSYRNGNNTYQNYPTTGGFYDSLIRVDKYMRIRETFLKQYLNY